MKRLIFIVTICIVALISTTTLAAERVKIIHGDLQGNGAPVAEWLARQVERFNAMNPNVTVEIIKIQDVDKLATLIAAGEQPDVTDGWTAVITGLARQNAFLNLNQLIAGNPQFAARNFIPSSVEDFTLEGVQWGIPGQAQPWITFYNEDILQQSGQPNPIRLGSGWTWQNLVSMGKKLTRDANGDGTPETYGVQAPTDILHNVVWVRQAGGSYFDRIVGGTKPTFTTPAVAQAWQFLQSLHTEHRIAEPGGNWLKGFVAFNFSDANYHIGPLQKNAKFKWDIARLPKGPVSDTTAVGGGGFQILNSCAHVNEALAWIKFLVTDKESAQDFMKTTGRVSAYLANAREYARLMTDVLDNINVSLEYMMEPYVKPRDVNPYFSDITKVVNPITAAMAKGQIAIPEAQQQAQHAAEVAMGLK